MTVVDLDVAGHLQAVVDHLNAADILTGYGRKPDGGGWTAAPGQSAFVPYAIVWRIGSIEARNYLMRVEHVEARPSVQVTCVGATPAQVDALVDAQKARMLDRSLTVPGRRLLQVSDEVGISTSKDSDVTPAVFYGGTRYRLRTLPAPQPADD